MLPNKIQGYLGLSTTSPGANGNFKEPPAETGYSRVSTGEIRICDIPAIPHDYRIVFGEAGEPGYGTVCCLGLFDKPEGGTLWYIWPFPEAKEVPAGAIPFVEQGKLLRGLDVSAKILIRSNDDCRM